MRMEICHVQNVCMVLIGGGKHLVCVCAMFDIFSCLIPLAGDTHEYSIARVHA